MARKKSTKTVQSGTKVKALESRLNQLILSNKKPKQKKKSTPFASAGQIAGRSIGGMFGNSGLGAGVGRWLGSGIGSIFGSGDYQQMGASPKYNVMSNGSQVPQFNTTRQTNIVCHREYLGDIQGTAGFNNTAYPLNPGMSQTFPWLSSVAGNYQEYRIHGLVFEFRSLITDFVTSGAPGVVVMSTNYNADAPIYLTKQQMENAEYAVSVKPTVNMMHGIECALGQTILPEKFIRSGSVPSNQDLRLYDLGNFQFATQANPIQDLGELWVSYCVEFFKPILPNDVGGNVLSSHLFRSGVTTATPLGVTQVFNTGQLGVVVGTTNITWFGQPNQQYLINLGWSSGNIAVTTNPTLSLTGLSFRNYLETDTTGQLSAPNNAVVANGTQAIVSTVVCTLLNPGLVTVTVSTSGVYPATTSVDVIVTELDNSVTA
jgi:hypothetical protein